MPIYEDQVDQADSHEDEESDGWRSINSSEKAVDRWMVNGGWLTLDGEGGPKQRKETKLEQQTRI